MSESTFTRITNDSSVEITKTTRGYTYSVKAYGANESEIKNKLNVLITTATECITQLEKK